MTELDYHHTATLNLLSLAVERRHEPDIIHLLGKKKKKYTPPSTNESWGEGGGGAEGIN